MSDLIKDTERSVAITHCNQILQKLEWDWNHPRVIDWLNRVMQIKHRQPFTTIYAVKVDYLVSLAKFLDLRYQCQKLLDKMQLSWDNPIIRTIEQRYKLVSQLPLKGYQELLRELEDLEYFDKMPF